MVVVADVDGLAAGGEAAAAIPRDECGPQRRGDFGFGGGRAEGDGAVDEDVAGGGVAGEALCCGGGELDGSAGGAGEQLGGGGADAVGVVVGERVDVDDDEHRGSGWWWCGAAGFAQALAAQREQGLSVGPLAAVPPAVSTRELPAILPVINGITIASVAVMVADVADM